MLFYCCIWVYINIRATTFLWFKSKQITHPCSSNIFITNPSPSLSNKLQITFSPPNLASTGARVFPTFYDPYRFPFTLSPCSLAYTILYSIILHLFPSYQSLSCCPCLNAVTSCKLGSGFCPSRTLVAVFVGLVGDKGWRIKILPRAHGGWMITLVLWVCVCVWCSLLLS